MTPRLRPATCEDGERLWAWRNDPAARAASLDQAAIPLDAHLAWFARALSDPNRQILIALGPDPIGMVRFDCVAPDVTVSITLAPEARGMGLARPILTRAIAQCRFRPARLCATIRPENHASLALFRALDFIGPADQNPITLTRTLL